MEDLPVPFLFPIPYMIAISSRRGTPPTIDVRSPCRPYSILYAMLYAITKRSARVSRLNLKLPPCVPRAVR